MPKSLVLVLFKCCARLFHLSNSLWYEYIIECYSTKYACCKIWAIEPDPYVAILFTIAATCTPFWLDRQLEYLHTICNIYNVIHKWFLVNYSVQVSKWLITSILPSFIITNISGELGVWMRWTWCTPHCSQSRLAKMLKCILELLFVVNLRTPRTKEIPDNLFHKHRNKWKLQNHNRRERRAHLQVSPPVAPIIFFPHCVIVSTASRLNACDETMSCVICVMFVYWFRTATRTHYQMGSL